MQTKTVKTYIKQLIKKFGKRRHVAQELGISLRYIYMLEKGEKVPSERPKAEKKEEKRKEKPELEVIEKKPEIEEVDELDELYTYDEEIEEESTESKDKPEVEETDDAPLEIEENSET